MQWSWPSRPVWTGAAVGAAIVAAVVAGYARPVIFDMVAEDRARSVRRFAAGAREVEVDPRPFWARIPRLLPPAHALRFPLGPRGPRRLDLYLYGDTDGGPAPRVTVVANGTPVTTVAVSPGVRTRVRIPAGALAGGAPAVLSLVNDSGPAVAWRRIRLVEGEARFSWRHLGPRGRLPLEAAVFLALSLGALLGRAVTRGDRPRGVSWLGLAAGLALLGAGLLLPADATLVARTPRWAWLTVPWIMLPIRPRAGARAGTLAVNALVSLGALALSLTMAELALRFVFRDVASAGDTRAYFQRAHSPEPRYEANVWGFREREFSLRKPPDTYRLAVVGDSFAFGAGLAPAERFSNLLERRLNDAARPGLAYEVLNFGRPGWDTEQEVQGLRMLVLGTRPDFVLLQWYVNDPENGDHHGRPRPWPLVPALRFHRALLRSSALYSLLAPHWARFQELLGLIESHSAYMFRRFGDPDTPDSVYAAARLREFIGECRSDGVPMGIVLFPRVGPDLADGTYEYGYLHERVLEVCGEERIRCVDLRAAFAAVRDYRTLWVTPLDGHPSALANRLATERLLEAFGDRWRSARRDPDA